jgi:hypothetical protein
MSSPDETPSPATDEKVTPVPALTSSVDEHRDWALLRHPLFIVIVTFALSGLLGVAFSQWLSARVQEGQRIRLESEARKDAVQALSRDIYERRARAEMLASSFRRGAALDEIKERKRQYDDVYVRWNTNHQANLFLVREVLRSDQYSFIESVLEFTLVGKIFRPLDVCLTSAFDVRANGGDPAPILDQCDAKRLLQEALDCGYAISDELFKLSGGVTQQGQAAEEIGSKCP